MPCLVGIYDCMRAWFNPASISHAPWNKSKLDVHEYYYQKFVQKQIPVAPDAGSAGGSTKQAIVVGGGLAGVSAANTILENGGRVLLLDKSSFCGGNSTKATSGINGSATKSQAAKGIQDSIELFTADTLKGGAKKPELVKVLCGNSGEDVDWLVDKFGLDLSLVARLGGHSAPRTHRGKERFPGMTITYALIQMVEKIAERTDRARII